MNLQFLNWHNLKCALSESKNRPFFQEREIWFAFVGKNIGFEQDGKGEKFLRSYRFGIVDEPTFTALKLKIRQFLA